MLCFPTIRTVETAVSLPAGNLCYIDELPEAGPEVGRRQARVSPGVAGGISLLVEPTAPTGPPKAAGDKGRSYSAGGVWASHDQFLVSDSLLGGT